MVSTIYTIGGLAIFSEAFRSISALLGEHAYITILKLFALYAFIFILIELVFKNKVDLAVRWFVQLFLIYSVLLVPKTSLIIYDTLLEQQEKVDGVPIALGLSASVISQIGFALTKLSEKVFTMPNDFAYEKSGMVLGSRLISEASRWKITDQKLKNNMDEFTHQCIFYDLLLNKYTYNELINSAQLWEFILQHASIGRAFRYDRKIISCKEGAQKINQDWKKELDRAAVIYGSRFFGGFKKNDAKAQLLSYLPISYQYLTKLSGSASQLMQQNMMINVIKDNIAKNAALTDASATVLNYASQRVNHMMRINFYLRGQLASYWLPLIQNVLSVLFYCSFLIIFPLFLFPKGMKLAKNYLISLFWLQCWQPLYAILNMIMTTYVAHRASDPGGLIANQGLTLLSQVGLEKINNDIVLLASYFSWSIPVLSYGLIKGSDYAMTQLFGFSNNPSAIASAEASTGNYNLGNTSFDEHHLHNSTAGHYDHNANFSQGQIHFTHASGTEINMAQDGHYIVDTQHGTSHFPGKLELAKQLRTGVKHEFEKSFTTAEKSTMKFEQANRMMLNNIVDYQNKFQQTSQHVHSHNTSSGHNFIQSSQQISNQIEDFATEHQISTRKAVEVLGKAHVGVLLGIEANLSKNVTSSKLSKDAHHVVTSKSWANSTERVSRVSDENQDQIRALSSEKFMKEFSRNSQNMKTYAAQAKQDWGRMEQYKHVSHQLEEEDQQWDIELNQSFFDWLVVQPSAHGQGKLGVENATHIISRETELLQMYEEKFMKEQIHFLEPKKNITTNTFNEPKISFTHREKGTENDAFEMPAIATSGDKE